MPGLDTLAATATMADVNVEAAKDGPTRNLHLELPGLALLGDLPAAIGALVRQGHVDDLVGLSAGNLAVGLGAVVLSGLAPRRDGRVFGRTFGERGGLPLVGSQDFLELRGQLADLCFEFFHSSSQSPILLE